VVLIEAQAPIDRPLVEQQVPAAMLKRAPNPHKHSGAARS